MATPAQCYYCFECLSAAFGGYEPIALSSVEELWEQHEQVRKLATLQATDDSVPLTEKEDDGYDSEDELGSGIGGDTLKPPVSNRPNAIKLPSISRLQSQMSPADSSSASTTPSSSQSSQSVASCSTAITTPSPGSDVAGTRQRLLPIEQRYPLFVTWNTLSKSGRKSLRGCIGTFEAQKLSEGLRSYALTSAFEDTRFSPIPESLLPSMSCSLTLLGSFEPCSDAMDWDLGTHGLRISFTHRARRHGATYLPDVPVEQGWTKEETVESLMRKAGWTGTSDSVAKRLLRHGSSATSSRPWEQVSDFRAVRYQGMKSSAAFEDWQEWRVWVLSLEDGREKLLESTV